MGIYFWSGGNSNYWNDGGNWSVDENDSYTFDSFDYPKNWYDIAIFSINNTPTNNILYLGENINILACLHFGSSSFRSIFATDFRLTSKITMFNTLCSFQNESLNIIGDVIFAGGIDNTYYNSTSGIKGDVIITANRFTSSQTMAGNIILSSNNIGNNPYISNLSGNTIVDGSYFSVGNQIGTCLMVGNSCQNTGTITGNIIFANGKNMQNNGTVTGKVIPLIPITGSGTKTNKQLDILGGSIL
jgi:hypothetical protein